MKDTNYFSHDYGARNDPKLIELQMDMGGQGLGVWWCLVEMLWEQDGYLPRNYKSLAFCLRWATAEEVRHVVEDFELFQMDDTRIWNNSALARKDVRDAMVERNRQAGKISGQRRREAKNTECLTSVEQVLNDRSTTVEPINKEIKEIKKEINYSSCACTRAKPEEEKEEVFKIFFFERNFREPQKELDRFWNYYDGRGWKWNDQKIESVEAVARQWKPENLGIKFPPSFLSWIARVYEAAREAGINWRVDMLRNIEKADEEQAGFDFRYWAKTKDWAQRIYNFVKAQNLDAGLRIDYKYML